MRKGGRKLRNVSHLAGSRELHNINKYAKEVLTKEEKQFIEQINKIVERYREGQRSEFISFQEWIKLRQIWQKYEHLAPFQFKFDPEKEIPELFKNEIAFIIWTAWRSRHLVFQDNDVESGSLAAAQILSKYKIPYPKEAKQKAVKEFLKHLHASYPEHLHASYPDVEIEINFWERYIFPYLEGKWQFRWERINQ